MENQVINTVEEGKVIIEPKVAPLMRKIIADIDKQLNSNDLLQALYLIWEAAERGGLDIFLVGDTAQQVKADQELKGDRITVGARRNEWVSGMGRIAQMYLEHEVGSPTKSDKDGLVYTTRSGVPIHIKLFEENPYLSSFEVVFYRYETFNLPNPYTKFVAEYES